MNRSFRQAAVLPVLLLSLAAASPVRACDSSMLTILTGSSIQKEITTKTLAICQKIQQTGEYLNGFNIAAARRLHREVMENWLQTATELTTLTSQNSNPGFSPVSGLLMNISRDLGKVRRQLDSDDMTLIHEILEATITRISLVSAVINDHQKMRKFLDIELAIFSLRPFFGDHTELQKLIGENHLHRATAEFRPLLLASETAELDQLDAHFNIFHAASGGSENRLSPAGHAAFQVLLNRFISFKQSLLNRQFFNTP
ncbi:MAG TPA: hypothetical protein PLK28_06985 [Candidatus Rifleibacterium sp.]|nr:hypothetical protein [Candidatus Rifleibacterium sp.]